MYTITPMKRDALFSLLVGVLFLCFVAFLVFETQVLRGHGCNREQHLGMWSLPTSNPIVILPHPAGIQSSGVETLYDAQAPPKQVNTAVLPDNVVVDGQPIPVNISTNARNDVYTQVGLLTLMHTHPTPSPVILPFMGRALQTARDKWQYYAIGGSIGAGMQTKLPVYVNGKICSGEYGCDRIYNGDTVRVEGYKEGFCVTIYETALLDYIG
jgi:hypothetical protein